jgi:long-subunit acyl-CoA synthetase (AMP-forming)
MIWVCAVAVDIAMENILSALRHHAQQSPSRIALRGAAVTLNYRELHHEVERLALALVRSGWRRVALMADNSPAWAVIDLAAAKAETLLVPLPAFFSDQQLAHALVDAGIERVITDQPQRFGGFAPQQQGSLRVAGVELQVLNLSQGATQVAAEIAKITYTSGTTAAPKGVMLKGLAIDTVSRSLALRTGVQEDDLHLCLLPLATLLENIGGLYVPLLAGAAIALPPLAEVGMRGASGVDIAMMVAALERYGATRAILLPQLLQALVESFESGVAIPPQLRFLAVGGAPVPPALLQRAAALGLPLFQGYGLSECCSVVALNNGEGNRPGSVGKPLPHVELRIAADGEILVRGALFSGYLGEPPPLDGEWLQTGDEGYLDGDGYLFITGRRKNIFITSFGRNVAPEWVEQELVLSPVIAQAYVYGEARPWNIAVLVTSAEGDAVQAAINAANSRLPDYARIKEWLRADAPFTVANGQLTATGRLRRQPLWQHYGERIEQRYSTAETIKEVSL